MIEMMRLTGTPLLSESLFGFAHRMSFIRSLSLAGGYYEASLLRKVC